MFCISRLHFSSSVSWSLWEKLRTTGGPIGQVGDQWDRTDRDSSWGTESPGTAPGTGEEQRSTLAVKERSACLMLNSALNVKTRYEEDWSVSSDQSSVLMMFNIDDWSNQESEVWPADFSLVRQGQIFKKEAISAWWSNYFSGFFPMIFISEMSLISDITFNQHINKLSMII